MNITAQLDPLPNGSPSKMAWWNVTSYSPQVLQDWTGLSTDDDASKVGVVETMTDIEGSFGVYNEVSHTKDVWDFPLQSFSMTGKGDYNGNTCTSVTNGRRSGQWGLVGGFNTPTSSWTTEADAVALATARMQFGVQDAPINLPTFLGELRDFRTVFKGIFGKARKPLSASKAGLLNRARNYLKTPGKARKVRDLIRSIISVDLTNKFAVQPLLRDLEALKRVNDHLVSQYSRLQRMKYHPVAVRGTWADDEVVTYTNNDDHIYHPSEIKETYSRHTTAWALVRYEVPDSLPSMPTIMADMLGFDAWHETAWQLMKLSFLLDYVADVSNWLAQFRGDLIQIPYTVLQEGYSVKTVGVTEVTTRYYEGTDQRGHQLWNDQDTNNRIVTGKVTRSRYKRNKLPLPFGSIAPLQFRLPSFQQGMTASEVAYMILGRKD